jgi:hypothetical protein
MPSAIAIYPTFASWRPTTPNSLLKLGTPGLEFETWVSVLTSDLQGAKAP